MSALTIAGVTAVLRGLLTDGLVRHDIAAVLGTAVPVSMLPPDRLAPIGGVESCQLNLFLYRVRHNRDLRHAGPPYETGTEPTRRPDVTLDLHFLISAHGAADLQREVLLGFAMHALDETPIVTPEVIGRILTPPLGPGATLPPVQRALAGSGLVDRIAHLRITPESLSDEQMGTLWSSMRAAHRPAVACMATVVLTGDGAS